MLTIADIMTRDIAFFDPAHEEVCVAFCRERKIFHMPSAEDDYVYFHLQRDGTFTKKELVDPNRKAELVQDVLYKFNGEIIRKLRTLTADKLGYDTYPTVTEVVVDMGNAFKSLIKEKMKTRSLINSQLVNEIVGVFMKKIAEELLRRLRGRLPKTLTDADWEEIETTFFHQLDSEIVYSITPILVYKTRRELMDELKTVHPTEALFKDDVYEKLRYSSLLFVMDQGKRVGMVHFSDYNRLPVFTQTFQRLHHLEREMVKALSMRKIQLKDLYVLRNMEQPPISEREVQDTRQRKNNDSEAILKYSDLEKLYLKTLLVLYNYRRDKEPINFSPIQHPNIINMLRNRIAHSNDLVELVDGTRSNLIYDFKSFAAFYRQQRALEVALKVVSSHNQYLTMDL